MPGGGAAGGVGDAVRAAVRAQRAVRCVGWAGDRAGGHLGRPQGVCGHLRWLGGGGEEQLVQQGDFHSLDRLGHKLVLVGVKAELVQQAGPRLAQLQLGVGAQDRDHVGEGHRQQLLQLRLRLAQLAQLQLDVQAHLGGVGGGG